MCANRDWFNTYEKKNEGEVLMGNDAACKIVGIGTLKVKMYNDIIRTFSNVRHVLSLKKNFISLGTLDANNYTYSSSEGSLKYSRGSMVVMREMLLNNLYKLLKDTISSRASLSKLENLEDDSAI